MPPNTHTHTLGSRSSQFLQGSPAVGSWRETKTLLNVVEKSHERFMLTQSGHPSVTPKTQTDESNTWPVVLPGERWTFLRVR